jgi:thiol-disulfide isomerase/thioredoxin
LTRSFRGTASTSFGFGLVLIAVFPAWAADPKPAANAAPVNSLTVRLLDADHKTVSGAHVGTFAYSSPKRRRPADESGLMYFNHCVSDKDGFARFPSKLSELADARGHVQIVARHVRRGLIVLADLDSTHDGPLVELTLVPECRISGKIVCRELAKIGHETGWTIVYLSIGRVQMMSCASENGELHFVVPPGRYDLNGYGTYVASKDETVTVPAGKREIALTLTAPANNLAKLIGHRAPELRDVAAWKNGPRLKLADLKGKCVLLEFWGYWCPPCIAGMPEIFRLFDQYGKQGLVVIGVHVDYRRAEVDSVEKLDAKLVETRNKLWHGRDLPFPVAITRHLDKKGAAVAEDYDIQLYPTTLLIDRRGNLVDIVPPGPGGLSLLQKALNE